MTNGIEYPFHLVSTVHKDITDRLDYLNPSLAKDVRRVLDVNKAERHIRGGMATREKYLKKTFNK
jgi:putative DeoR family transcriptional regulator (stage III sporulation protein D)